MITSGIHFAVTLTLNLWQWSPRFSQWKQDLFSNPIKTSILVDIYKRQVSPFSLSRATFELVDIYKSQVSPFSPYRTTSSLVASQPVMSLRPLNRQIAKSHPFKFDKDYFELGGFLIGYVIATSEPTDSQVSPFKSDKDYFELGGFSIGYVIVTSEPADSQVSPFSPTRTTFELGGFSIGYVIATSEPADSQVSSFSPARTISLSSYDKVSSLVASQSVTSLRPLNRRMAKSHYLVQ